MMWTLIIYAEEWCSHTQKIQWPTVAATVIASMTDYDDYDDNEEEVDNSIRNFQL